MTAEELFAAKSPTVHHALLARFRGYDLQDADREDIEQHALTVLWRQCLSAATPEGPARFQINCWLIAAAGLDTWRRGKPRRTPKEFPEGYDPQAPTTTSLDGYTMADARIDYPDRCRTWLEGVSPAEFARRRGVSRQFVAQQPERFCGMVYRHHGQRDEWKYPAR